MWNAAVDGRRLRLHLCGINNQNFLMRDDQTGTWWQQASGEALLGPLRGRRLRLQPADETSFALWRREHPAGRVLRPADDPAWRRWSAGWEEKTARLPVVAGVPGADGRGPLPPREVVLGVDLGAAARAYPVAVLLRNAAVVDDLGGVPVVILVGEDGHSLRVFESRLDGRPLPLFLDLAGPAAAASSAPPRRWRDGVSGSEWDFQGRAVAGPWRGRQLRPLPSLRDYWFDWRTYHPRTTVYIGGAGAPAG